MASALATTRLVSRLDESQKKKKIVFIAFCLLTGYSVNISVYFFSAYHHRRCARLCILVGSAVRPLPPREIPIKHRDTRYNLGNPTLHSNVFRRGGLDLLQEKPLSAVHVRYSFVNTFPSRRPPLAFSCPRRRKIGYRRQTRTVKSNRRNRRAQVNFSLVGSIVTKIINTDTNRPPTVQRRKSNNTKKTDVYRVVKGNYSVKRRFRRALNGEIIAARHTFRANFSPE